jgi:hypothetical protein
MGAMGASRFAIRKGARINAKDRTHPADLGAQGCAHTHATRPCRTGTLEQDLDTCRYAETHL